MQKLFPLKRTEVDGLIFRYLRSEPPHNPDQFSAQGIEFHHMIRDISGEVALDIGANIGSYTLHLARRFHSVTAFEPSKVHCKILRLNVRLNRLDNVRVEEAALSDVEGEMPLYIRRSGATSLDPSHYGLKFDRVYTVKVAKLDNFQSLFKQLDFVKIDAENLEYRIMKGGMELISRFHPILAVEVHRDTVPSGPFCGCDTCDLIRSLGYRVAVIGKFSSVGEVHWVWASPG